MKELDLEIHTYMYSFSLVWNFIELVRGYAKFQLTDTRIGEL